MLFCDDLIATTFDCLYVVVWWLLDLQRFQHRHIYDVPKKADAMSKNDEENLCDMPVYQESEPFRISMPGFVENNDISVSLSRNDVAPETI